MYRSFHTEKTAYVYLDIEIPVFIGFMVELYRGHYLIELPSYSSIEIII